MAMNKKEMAMMQALRERAALNWTGEVKPDLLPPACGSGGVSQGWDFNEHTNEAYPAWSSSINHSRGNHDKPDRTSVWRNPVHLYSSEELALRALRGALERKFAKQLARIDEALDALALRQSEETEKAS